MQTQNGGRPTILPKMYEEPLFSQIIDKIESGCNDREIYTSLHCSAKTFRKWRDDNIKAYDEAKSIARGNLLELAESALDLNYMAMISIHSLMIGSSTILITTFFFFFLHLLLFFC